VAARGRLEKNFTTPALPDATSGLCWTYPSVSHLSASSQWLHCSKSRSM
jgi:hypothetical protein